MEKPQTWYVYTYAFPDGTVFYIGKGTGDRINHHEREAASGCDCGKCQTIRGIWESEKPVKKRIVFETLIEAEALAKELELIQAYSSSALTNIKSRGKRNTSRILGMRPLHDYYTASEVEHLLNVSNAVIRSYVKSGKIRYIIPHGRKQGFYLKSDVDGIVNELAAFFREAERQA